MLEITVFAALFLQEPSTATIVHQGRPLSQWIAELTNKNYDVQEKAVKALVSLGADGVPALVATLSDPRAGVRAGVAAVLGKIKDPRAVPALLPLLGDRTVRDSAALALGELGDRRAVGPLIATIEAEGAAKDFKAFTSIGALGQIGGDEARNTLARLLASDPRPFVRQQAVDALADTLGEADLEPLGAALNDRDAYVREKAARRLGRFDVPRVLELLDAAAKDPKTGHEAAAALRDVDTRGKPSKTAGKFQVTLLGVELTNRYGTPPIQLVARRDGDIVVVRYRLKALVPVEREIESVELYDDRGEKLPSADVAAGRFSVSFHADRKAGEAVTSESTFAAKKGTKFGTVKIHGADFDLADLVATRR